jgi:DNA (cytosine-5)-methyltransferase 1
MAARKYSTIDLFAGIGGIRLGFERNGFETVFANDFDPYCKATYDLNFDGARLTVGDIAAIPSSKIPDFDILLGGFPCQPFSIAGYRKGFLDTGRGDLFFEIIRIIRDKKPKAVFLENVKNLRSHDNGRTFAIITTALEDLGYHVKHAVLNSMQYGGVPQNRERIYIVGFRSKKHYDAFEFPQPAQLNIEVADILEKRVDKKYYYDKSPLFSTLKGLVRARGVVYQWRRRYVRQNKSGVCPTLTANMGTGGHNVPLIRDHKGIRKLTPRECARLQGFPDSYKMPIELPNSRLYKQFGNSVTTTVIERVAANIKRALEYNSNVIPFRATANSNRPLQQAA